MRKASKLQIDETGTTGYRLWRFLHPTITTRHSYIVRNHINMNPNKKYGLILSKKSKEVGRLKPRLSAFSNDDSGDEDGKSHVNSQIHKEAMKKIMKKQTKLEIQKAIEEDATVYEYDNIYDDMKASTVKQKTPAAITKADKLKKPKYIGSLMKAAEARQRERQRIEERKIEKERQKEGDEFKDKPEFVTSAYKKRMQERQEEEEREKREAAIEDALDVRKQKDLSGFYRHFLRQQMGEEPSERSFGVDQQSKEVVIKPDSDNNKDELVADEDDQDTDLSFSSGSSDEEENTPQRSDNSHKRLHEEESNQSNTPPHKTDHRSASDISGNRSKDDPPSKQHKGDSDAISAFKKRTNEKNALSARERYLARKNLKQPKQALVESE